MPPSPDGAPAAAKLSRRSVLLILAMIAAGFGLTLLVFYPGVMTYDARFVYEDIAKGVLGDWQSPVMTVLWALIDPIAPGSASMFLLIVTLYWLAFGLLAFTLARHSIWLAVVLLLLALSPPAFVFQGIIWRDVLFADSWLLAAALSFAAADRSARLRALMQATGAWPARARRSAASECAYRRADSRRHHRLAGAIFLEARGDPLCADRRRAVCAGAG